jgi:hypothetical protein
VALPGTLPIGVESDGRTVLVYLATEVSTDTFRRFLQGHAALLRVAPTWTLRIIFPRPLDRVYDAYQTVIHEELESPLHPATISAQVVLQDRDKATREPMHPQDQRFIDVGAYRHLSPLVDQRGSRAEDVEKGVEKGARKGGH